MAQVFLQLSKPFMIFDRAFHAPVLQMQKTFENIIVSRFVWVHFHISSPIAGRVFPLKGTNTVSKHLFGEGYILCKTSAKNFSYATMVDIF